MLKMLRKIYRKVKGSQPAASKVSKVTPLVADIYNKVKPYTMTSLQRINCLVDAVNYIVDNNIEGDFVECGVWKGGSVMAMSYTLLERKVYDRKIHLYDTFDGMSSPTEEDEDLNGIKAKERLATEDKATSWGWAYSPINEVRNNLDTVGYPQSCFNIIQGKVEETIPGFTPNKIALLRLDTDWYESTKIELEYLFPKLVKGGILIIDDYGHWKGCRKAVDEYIGKNKVQIFLSSIDYTGRIAVKLY